MGHVVTAPGRTPAALGRREPVVGNILLLDGLSRAGKFLLAKVICQFRNVEYFQYHPAIEHIPILWTLGCLNTGDAVAFLQLTVELHTYDFTIGRCLNTRVGDNSSILNAPDSKRYLDRAASPDGASALLALRREGRMASFVTHECVPHLSLFFQAFPDSKIVNIQRHPIDTIHSWHKRSWGSRFGTDPLSFIPTASAGEGAAVPWFAASWVDEYRASSPVDRVVKSVLVLSRLEREARAALPALQAERVHFICHEHLVENPHMALRDVPAFLGSEPLPDLDAVLRRERCFQPLPVEGRRRKFDEISQDASPALVREMAEASSDYESRWSLPSVTA